MGNGERYHINGGRIEIKSRTLRGLREISKTWTHPLTLTVYLALLLPLLIHSVDKVSDYQRV